MPGNVIEHITPSCEQLQPFQQITCSQPDCNKIFTNQPNYQMHLEKHHRIKVDLSDGAGKFSCIRLYYCPVNGCGYWYGKENRKHFKNMKYIRQHYQKVHMAKSHLCDKCGKAFSTEGQLRRHKEDSCGRAFACSECGWSYDSMESLLTHGKRKGHNVRDIITSNKTKRKVADGLAMESAARKVQRPQKKPRITDGKHEISVQTIDFMENIAGCSSQMSAGVQTDLSPQIPIQAWNSDLTNDMEEFQSMQRDIEAQTEPLLCTGSTNETHTYLDQMLAQSHMYTQTCDDFFSELGLAEIQTQTHWPSPKRHEENLQFTSTATSTSPVIYDELLVSTETQTSFTQCLLNSCTDSGTSTSPVSFGSLYHTQYTQTCGEPLLESFDFGGQASDIMDRFQSTYTQTGWYDWEFELSAELDREVIGIYSSDSECGGTYIYQR